MIPAVSCNPILLARRSSGFFQRKHGHRQTSEHVDNVVVADCSRFNRACPAKRAACPVCYPGFLPMSPTGRHSHRSNGNSVISADVRDMADFLHVICAVRPTLFRTACP